VQLPGSDVEVYVQNLDRLLMSKMEMIMGLRRDLMQFNANLQMEKSLQNIYHQRKSELGFEHDEMSESGAGIEGEGSVTNMRH